MTARNKDHDEKYIIDLCDHLLGEISLRQFNGFDFLVGDSRGSRRPNRLAVDAYYPKHKLVIEFNERQHDEAVKFFDKPDRITASGVHRGEQRKIYDNRRAELLPKNGIKLIVLRYDQFLHNSNRKLRRIPTDDLQTIRDILQNLQIKID